MTSERNIGGKCSVVVVDYRAWPGPGPGLGLSNHGNATAYADDMAIAICVDDGTDTVQRIMSL